MTDLVGIPTDRFSYYAALMLMINLQKDILLYNWGLQGYTFSLFLLQNIDCGYSLEPPKNEAVLTCTHNQCFEQK